MQRSPQGLACAGMAFIALGGALFAVGMTVESIVKDDLSWTLWSCFASAILCAVCAVVVLAFQACRGPTGWAAPQSPVGTTLCGIGLFWNIVLLACFVAGTLPFNSVYDPVSDSYISLNGFELFSYWEPKWQAFFIFSCCICVAAWAAALVLAAFDSSTLKRRQMVTMCSTAGGLDKEAPLDAAFNKDSAFAAVVLPAV